MPALPSVAPLLGADDFDKMGTTEHRSQHHPPRSPLTYAASPAFRRPWCRHDINVSRLWPSRPRRSMACMAGLRPMFSALSHSLQHELAIRAIRIQSPGPCYRGRPATELWLIAPASVHELPPSNGDCLPKIWSMQLLRGSIRGEIVLQSPSFMNETNGLSVRGRRAVGGGHLQAFGNSAPSPRLSCWCSSRRI